MFSWARGTRHMWWVEATLAWKLYGSCIPLIILYGRGMDWCVRQMCSRYAHLHFGALAGGGGLTLCCCCVQLQVPCCKAVAILALGTLGGSPWWTPQVVVLISSALSQQCCPAQACRRSCLGIIPSVLSLAMCLH